MFALETERLWLRDLLPQDAAPMHLLRSDRVVTRYCAYIESETPEQAEAWVRDTMVHNATMPRLSYNLAIVGKADQAVLGWIGIGQASDPTLGELSFGYALRPAYWGQGYMTEALTALLGYAFDALEAQSVQGECDAANPASARVMEKAGMRFVRRVPEDDGSESDYYAVTAAEWVMRRAPAADTAQVGLP
jgi:RimJ/RimL family protein N-acetyltransferase